MSDNFVVFMILLYNFAIVAGASYLVAVYNWSMWTYLLAMCFMLSTRKKDD
jgi:uncharacterized protein (DUF983 family)